MGYMVSATTTQFCHCRMKVAIHINKWTWLYSNKPYLQKQAADRIWPMDHSLLIPDLEESS